MKKVLKSLGIVFLYLIAYNAIQLIGNVVLVVIGMINVGNIDSVDFDNQLTIFMTGKTATIVLISNLLTILILFFIRLGDKKKFISAVSLNKVTAKDLIFPAILGLTFYFTVSGILNILPIPDSLVDQSNSLISGSIWIQLISIVFIAPITEELIFRGLILKRLSREMHPIIAAIISSVFFAIIHGNPIGMASAFIGGLGMSFVCLNYRSVMASIAMHMVFNMCGLIEGNIMKSTELGGASSVIFIVLGMVTSGLLVIHISRINSKIRNSEVVSAIADNGI